MSTTLIVTNNKKCPVCGSDTVRNKTDNRHDLYKEEHTCKNAKCGVSVTFRN